MKLAPFILVLLIITILMQLFGLLKNSQEMYIEPVKPVNASCSTNTECSSGKCVNGKCA